MQNHHRLDYTRMNDEELVLRSQHGDNHAFTVLIERHQSTCQKLAFSILRERQDAEDEVQNACWKAYEHICQFQSDAKFSTWLTRIVVNQCLMRLRQIRRSRLVHLEDAPAAEQARAQELPARTDTPEQSLAKSELARLLQHEIRRIPPLLRHVFLLRDVQERPIEEVADSLGISIPAAKSRLLRARLELRSRMRKHMPPLGPLPA